MASGRRFSTASSHTSRRCGGTSTGWSISAAFTIPTSMPDDTHAWCKKVGVDRLADDVHPAEPEAQVRHAAADLAPGAQLLDGLRRFDEVHSIIVVLLDAGADRQNVRVEDNVLGREADRLVHEDVVASFTNTNLVLLRRRLALLVERHHDHRRAVLS